jgi:hypothetical protein
MAARNSGRASPPKRLFPRRRRRSTPTTHRCRSSPTANNSIPTLRSFVTPARRVTTKGRADGAENVRNAVAPRPRSQLRARNAQCNLRTKQRCSGPYAAVTGTRCGRALFYRGCYSARLFDPSVAYDINGLRRRSALEPAPDHAQVQIGGTQPSQIAGHYRPLFHARAAWCRVEDRALSCRSVDFGRNNTLGSAPDRARRLLVGSCPTAGCQPPTPRRLKPAAKRDRPLPSWWQPLQPPTPPWRRGPPRRREAGATNRYRRPLIYLQAQPCRLRG